ncbi:IS200/IS605 family accessory protein TnpB-related protein [Endozoicomonas acroporae]|uniref:IS200/IS605 family accessory protein TnpB-related protein n=1 Tax=Endozoicomonas acroporae TaxID=1701104 RepID=UPI0013D13108|nr:IS200/IS605 family accessory protein TnpB-related protein [Endozoicomonas acroporae]
MSEEAAMSEKGSFMTDSLSLTFQTRLNISAAQNAALSAIAGLMSSIERGLYVQWRKGQSLASLKNKTIARNRIPARYFNAAKASLEGKIRSVISNLANSEDSYQRRIKAKHRHIKKQAKALNKEENPQKRAQLRFGLHQSKRRLSTLKAHLLRIRQRLENNDPAICFGSKALFKKQFHLEKNGYCGHNKWQQDWQDARQSQFFIIGSKDESHGCQLCALTQAKDGTLSARLRVPDALVGEHGQYLELTNIHFAHGGDAINAALEKNQRRKSLSLKAGRDQFGDLYKHYGQALSFRFARDKKGWRLLVTTAAIRGRPCTCPEAGAMGLDINADHLALALIDRHGNPLNKWTIPCHTFGKTSEQRRAVIGDACKQVVKLAKQAGVPLVMEHLSFRKKKDELEKSHSARYARMLSGLAYDQIHKTLVSRAYREGVGLTRANPAYTSVIGRTKFSGQYGLSVHHGAAVAIARRYFRFSERLPRGATARLWDDRAGHVALRLPEDNGKHVWTRWAILRGKLGTALAERPKRSKHPPALSATAGLCEGDSGVVFDTVPPF